MSCYHPLVAYPKDRPNENGNIEYRIIGALDQTVDIDEEAIRIPCGKCIGCRLDQSRRWADRMMLELDVQKKGIFLTLTYDDDHVPFTENDNGEFGALTLWKPDLQKFFKRLRKDFGDKKLRYYAVGEYGSNTFRPHYHAIIFGLSYEDFPDWQYYKRNELGDQLFMSRWLQEKVWKQGICTFSDVTWQTCAYVARYVQKKIFAGHDILCDMYGVDPEFSVMSRNPGIGYPYLEKHPELFNYSSIYVSNYDRGISIPKYYLDKLKLTNPELYDNLLNVRKVFASENEILKLKQTDLGRDDYLEVEEVEKLSKNQALKRKL